MLRVFSDLDKHVILYNVCFCIKHLDCYIKCLYYHVYVARKDAYIYRSILPPCTNWTDRPGYETKLLSLE